MKIKGLKIGFAIISSFIFGLLNFIQLSTAQPSLNDADDKILNRIKAATLQYDRNCPTIENIELANHKLELQSHTEHNFSCSPSLKPQLH